MKSLKAIFFDIDDTLYSTSEFARRARANSIDAMIAAGLKMGREELMAELEEVIAEFSSNYSYHFDKLLVRLPPKALEGINPAMLVAAAVVAYHETKFRELKPYEDVPPLLKDLTTAGVVTGVITAGPTVKQAEKLVRLDLARYLDGSAIFISDQIGISKPNPKLYLRACEALGVEAAHAMYVGDNPPNDIDPPKSLGMITVLNRRSGKYSGVPCRSEPDYRIRDFTELRRILRSDFGLPV